MFWVLSKHILSIIANRPKFNQMRMNGVRDITYYCVKCQSEGNSHSFCIHIHTWWLWILEFWFGVQLTDGEEQMKKKKIKKFIQDQKVLFLISVPFLPLLDAKTRICKICIMHCGSEKWDRDEYRIRKKYNITKSAGEKCPQPYISNENRWLSMAFKAKHSKEKKGRKNKIKIEMKTEKTVYIILRTRVSKSEKV